MIEQKAHLNFVILSPCLLIGIEFHSLNENKPLLLTAALSKWTPEDFDSLGFSVPLANESR